MRHVYALLLKTALTGVVLFISMNVINQYPIGSTFALSLLVVGLSYLLGDLGILPLTNNSIATLSDLGLATLTIWVIGPFMVEAPIPFGIAFWSAVAIAIGEWFLHKFMFHSVLPGKKTAE